MEKKAKRCWCKGEAKRRRLGGRRSVTDAEEGEVSPMWRNQSVSDAEKSKSMVVTTSRIVVNGSYRHRLRIVTNGLLGLCLD